MLFTKTPVSVKLITDRSKVAYINTCIDIVPNEKMRENTAVEPKCKVADTFGCRAT